MEDQKYRIQKNREMAINRQISRMAKEVLNEIIDVIEAKEEQEGGRRNLTTTQLVRIKKNRREAIIKAEWAQKRMRNN
uniref:Uncharacterized protein n=2 Tax=Meloidogyne TaxID=189290 RepID=A0A6V7VX65_MELEN|nr:unnamed protein product [Meloidogyne enterolobii]